MPSPSTAAGARSPIPRWPSSSGSCEPAAGEPLTMRGETKNTRSASSELRGPAAQPKPINLALQGGGAHGAFTWGVLDALLADGRLSIAAITGASAGAINAVVLADGPARGGVDGARRRLAPSWRRVTLATAGAGEAADVIHSS